MNHILLTSNLGGYIVGQPALIHRRWLAQLPITPTFVTVEPTLAMRLETLRMRYSFFQGVV